MRLFVWALGLSLCACGKIDSPETPLSVGGQGGRSATVGGSASAGDNRSGAGTNAGGAGALGGSAANGAVGSVAGSGGTAADVSGEGGASGEAAGATSGEAGGAGGAASLGQDEMYDVCGCGCCLGPLANRCYYPALGENLEAIKAADQAIRNGGSCATAACSFGVHYVRCETADVEPGASYGVVGYSDSRQHLSVNRSTTESGGRCTTLKIDAPGSPREGFELELPGQYGLTAGSTLDGACNGMTTAATRRPEIGALGSWKQSAPQSCAYDFDFTLFFLADDGTADAVRFKAKGIALSGMANGTCP